MRRFILFRHGETDWNKQGFLQGRTDIPLNKTGTQQAGQLRDQLVSTGIKLLVTSPLLRARETAMIVNSKLLVLPYGQQLESAILHVPLIEDKAFVEADCGCLEERNKSDFEDYFKQWESPLYPMEHPINGEVNADVYTRSITALMTLARTYDHDVIGVSTHGGIIRRLLNYTFPISGPHQIANASYVMLDYTFSEGHTLCFSRK